MKKMVAWMAAFLACVSTVLAHGVAEENASSVMAFEHTFAVVLAIAALVAGIRAAKHVKGNVKDAVMYFVSGIVAVGLIHLAEFLFEVLHVAEIPEMAMMHIEHILIYVGLVLFTIGFMKLKK